MTTAQPQPQNDHQEFLKLVKKSEMITTTYKGEVMFRYPGCGRLTADELRVIAAEIDCMNAFNAATAEQQHAPETQT
jgi:hypothetical protein